MKTSSTFELIIQPSRSRFRRRGMLRTRRTRNLLLVHIVAAMCVLRGMISVQAQTTYEPYYFTRFAGLPSLSGTADGTAHPPQFNGAESVVADSSGNVYVADTYNHAIRKITPAGVVSTLAGLAGTAGSVDGTGSGARFNYPTGIALDSAGNIYVADSENDTIRKITPAGAVSTLAGLAGSHGSADGVGSAARFYSPAGVAVDSAGNVYVADYFTFAIRKITPAAVVSTIAGLAGSPGSADGTGSAARFNYPRSVALDSAGNVYVADFGNETIRKITPAGVVSTFAGLVGNTGTTDGTGSAARFTRPASVASDSGGNVYVADSSNHTIRRITPAGVVSTVAGVGGNSGSSDGTATAARFYYPLGVAVDSAGNLHVADSGNSTLRKITPGAVVSTLAGSPGDSGSADGTVSAAARFNYPRGVVADAAGNVYVADTANDTIRKITPAGVVSTVAGLAGSIGSNDGSGSSARFAYPVGIGIDTGGNLYVGDYLNHTVRKISATGVVSTFAGTAGAAGSADGTGGAARFNNPQGVAVDAAGNVYVADYVNHTIRKITPAGVVSTLAGFAGSIGNADGNGSAARFAYPQGVAVDGSGNVYVADTDNSTIRKITPAGVVSTVAGLAGATGSADGMGSAARFDHPRGLAVDDVGNIYVTDTVNQTIRKVTPAGLVTTLGGSVGNRGVDNGVGEIAHFSDPADIAVDSIGRVYVADYANHAIRIGIAPAHLVSASAHKLHGAIPNDIDLPQIGQVGIECRSATFSGLHQVILTFGRPVTFSDISVSPDPLQPGATASISSYSISGSQVLVNLSGVSNAQTLTLKLSNVSDGTYTNPNVSVRMGVLLADVNGDGSVNSADATRVRNFSGASVDWSNFRADFNLDGYINSADATTVRSRSGTSLP